MGHKDQNKGRWYIRNGNRIQGPFPNQLISSYLVLGRIELDTEISQDQEHWAPVRNYKALVPEVVLNAHTSEGAKELMLARVREDERCSQAGDFEDTELDRRENEDQVVKLHRQLRDDVLKSYRTKPELNIRNLVIVITIFIILLLLIIVLRPVNEEAQADCSSTPERGVNWSHCNKQGQNLSGLDLSASRFESSRLNNADFSRARLDNSNFSYADLSQALMQQASMPGVKMVGAILRQTNLQGANLSNADLSYAELEGANLDEAVLDGVRFDNAIWINGETCLSGSTGTCLLPSK
ncbi:MAG: pentapeptide repeat-containing protein [Gammaproteobacteria bacterium]|nr:pentapeptide repeat-containing protein [Gammaproteobacteria bacterium]MCW8910635.1 pentapeptide repeat-containing protein [Gammaproteobacteria bacterium]MCW9005033.1 pentapeptide repeat-containing protein [Gammaproteobacteria bacterium]MCW9055081.1 pentapeptide repeat-containing protein [Gammaproteobacteria bacterium]